MNASILPPTMNKIVGQTEFFNLGIATSVRKENPHSNLLNSARAERLVKFYICLIDRNPKGRTALDQSGPGSNDNEEVLNVLELENWSLTTRCSFEACQGYPFWRGIGQSYLYGVDTINVF